MSAEDCDQCNDGKIAPTKDEWDRMESVIKAKYYQQGCSLRQLKEYMHTNYGFHAKERQYKTRFKDWKQPSKRIEKKQYLAMRRIIDEHPASSQGMLFKAWRGKLRVDITPQQISKELGRSSKLRASHLASPPPQLPPEPRMSVRQAEIILQEADIEWWGSQLQRDPSAASAFREPASPSGSDSTATVSTPGTTEASPMRPIWHQGIEHSHNGLGSSRARLLSPATGLHTEGYDIYGFSEMWNSVESSDSLKVPGIIESQLNQPLPWPKPAQPLDDPKRMVYNWADPWVKDSFPDKCSIRDLNQGKIQGLDALRFMLKADPSNEFIFPCLLQMLIVLNSNGRWGKLRDFLDQTCRIFDEIPISTDRLHVQSVFRYARAASADEKDLQMHYGDELHAAYQYFSACYGIDHPHALVTSLFRAWHFLDIGQHQEVFPIVQACLKAAEDLVRLKNWRFLILNCLSILGRACAEINEHKKACAHFDAALQQIDNRPHLCAVRWVLTLRLAVSKAKCGELSLAITHVKSVIKGRIQLFKYSSPKTWFAIDTYCRILREAGHAQEADMEHSRHIRNHDLQWFLDTGAEVPEELQDVGQSPVLHHLQPHPGHGVDEDRVRREGGNTIPLE